MFKKLINRLSFAIPVLLATTQANAHPGGHAELSTTQLFNHILASPYHTGLFVGIAITATVIIWRVSIATKSD